MVAQVLQEAMAKSTKQLKEASRLKKEDDERIKALEEEVKRVSARCKELVRGNEEASEASTRRSGLSRSYQIISDQIRSDQDQIRSLYHDLDRSRQINP